MPTDREAPPLTFLAEWFDPLPQLTRQFRLRYWGGANEAELVDLKSKRLFLKRSRAPDGTTTRDFYVGAKVVLYGRELTLAAYGDRGTAEALTPAQAQTVIVVNPEHWHEAGAILDALTGGDAPLTLARLRLFHLSEAQSAEVAAALAPPGDDGSAADAIADRLARGSALAAVVLGPGVVESLADAAPSVSAHFASDSTPRGGGAAVWAAPDARAADAAREALFGPGAARRMAPTATLDSCTCCVIKPHAVKGGLTGRILDHVLKQGYEVTALEMFHLDRVAASEFLEVYSGTVPEYKELVEHMITSPCVAMEVRAEDAVDTFRQTAGPWDVEMARELRPQSLRALYGADRVRSGVHCTELKEDGVTECQYFFEVLQN